MKRPVVSRWLMPLFAVLALVSANSFCRADDFVTVVADRAVYGRV